MSNLNGIHGLTGIELLRAEHFGNSGLRNLNFEYEDCFADLAWGHPDPTLEPVEEIRAAVDATLTKHGWQAIAYGWQAGPAVLRESVAAHLTSLGEGLVSPSQVVSCAGSSGGLDLLATLLFQPGDTVLVAEPTYFLALRIFGDHPVRLVGVPCDDEGVIPDDLERAAADGAKFLYCIPTFANPTGSCWTDERKLATLAVAARHGMTVFEDDVYRELSFDGLAPRSMWSMDTEDVVARIGTFSKTLSPGLRVGFITAPERVTQPIIDCGMLDSGGGANHFIATVIGDLLATPLYGEIVRRNVDSYRERAAALAAGLGGGSSTAGLKFSAPTGGYFLWCELPDGVDRSEFLAAAAASGVRCSNGAVSFIDDRLQRHIRMSWSLLPATTLAEAGRRVSQVLIDLDR
jgi:2-aminoadipate transaminase